MNIKIDKIELTLNCNCHDPARVARLALEELQKLAEKKKVKPVEIVISTNEDPARTPEK